MFQTESQKGLHYNFAHLALPILSLMNPKKFYTDISGRKGHEYLNSIWNGLARKLGEPSQQQVFKITSKEIIQNQEAFVIQLPTPKNVPEAFFVATVFKINKQIFSKNVEHVRYFTLELGKNPFTPSINEFHVCEWAGNMLSSPRHDNYGQLEKADENSFITAIKEVITTGKLNQSKFNDENKGFVPTAKTDLARGSSEKPTKPRTPDVSDLLLLVQKHKNLVAGNSEKLYKNLNTLKDISHKTFIQFVLENDDDRKVFPKGTSDAEQYLEMSSTFTLRAISIAFVLGREYAEHYKENPKELLYAEKIDSVAIRESTQNELKRVSEYAVFWITKLDEMCFFAGYIDKATMLSGVDTHISQAQTSILNAFQDGVVTYWDEVFGTKR